MKDYSSTECPESCAGCKHEADCIIANSGEPDLQVSEIESLRQQLAECQATNGKLRSDMSLFLDSHEECEDFDGFTAQIVSMYDYHKAQKAITLTNDSTALNELIAERTKELTAEVDKWKSTAEQHKENYDILNGDLRMKNAELTAQRDAAMKDAERYRWLVGEAEEVHCRFFDWETNGGDYGERDATLDEAIDAAIANCKERK